MIFVLNAPDGHAHNDFLHTTAAAGIPAGMLFLLMAYFVFYGIFSPGRMKDKKSAEGPSPFLSAGMSAFLAAGTAQCYFQDDEVVILFWVAAALSASGSFYHRMQNSGSDA